jgi:hypothetical protein
VTILWPKYLCGLDVSMGNVRRYAYVFNFVKVVLSCAACKRYSLGTPWHYSDTWVLIVCEFSFLGWGGLSPFGTSAIAGLLYQLRMIDDGDSGAIDGMKICRGNRSTWRKPAPMPLCPPQIPHYLTLARTRVAAVGNRRLTAWAMARPL